MELKHDVLVFARVKDAVRAAGGEFGEMHGIPALLKDNIAAAGGNMHWTAGAWAMRDLVPDRDALLVQQLRDSGAIIMGKANLSEWANWIDLDMPNGFSTLGGQARLPYGPFDPQGSSSGPAVSAAANFTAVSVGTETSCSIISPAELPVSELAISLILAPGFKIDLNLLLSQLGDLAPHPSLEAIIAANDEDSANRVPYGQDSLILSQESAMTEEEYRQGFDEGRVTVIDRVNQVIDTYDIDVLYGDGFPYNAAGFPAITLPIGYEDTGLPRGILLTGGYLSEPALIQVAYAIEQTNPARVAPDLEASMSEIDALND